MREVYRVPFRRHWAKQRSGRCYSRDCRGRPARPASRL